jgi:hypothetical protein
MWVQARAVEAFIETLAGKTVVSGKIFAVKS